MSSQHSIPRGGVEDLNRIADGIDAGTKWIGWLTAWAMLGCVLMVMCVVVARYVFQLSELELFGVPVTLVRMQEAYLWWLHDLVLMVGAAFTLLMGGHVRVDIIYSRMGWRFRAWVDLLGTLFLLWPMMAGVAWYSWTYVASSWARMEGSSQAGGLPGLYLVKGLIILFCVLMARQGISIVCRSLSYLVSPPPPEDEPVAAANPAMPPEVAS